MLTVYGNMRVAQVVTNQEELEGLKVTAKQYGSNLLVEDGNYLYARAIFLGYDLPNGNGDAIPSLYAGTFGPSFIGKHVDENHEDVRYNPEAKIGDIMATWHVQKPMPTITGSRIIGRNVLGRDIEGRKVFGLAANMAPEPSELQLEGIFRLDRSTKKGDLVAKKLLAKEITSVSQEAATAYCLCSVCAHRIGMPFDLPCTHLTYGSLMLKSYQVPGYDDEILAYKVHHEPTGTGLGAVGIPAYDKAKVAELTAALKSGQMDPEMFTQLMHQQEMVWGKTPEVVAAMHDWVLITADLRNAASARHTHMLVEAAPLAPKAPKPEMTKETPGVALTPETVAAAMPGKDVEAGKALLMLAAAEPRLNVETRSLIRHAALATAQNETVPENNINFKVIADRICSLAEVQGSFDAKKKELFAVLGFPRGEAEGLIMASQAAPAVRGLGLALISTKRSAAIFEAKAELDRFMPGLKSFNVKASAAGVLVADQANQAFEKVEAAWSDFTKKFDAWKVNHFEESGAKDIRASYVQFKASFGNLSQIQDIPVIATLADAVDQAFGVAGAPAAPKRLRTKEGFSDLVAAYRSNPSDGLARTLSQSFVTLTASHMSMSETTAIQAMVKAAPMENSAMVAGAIEGLTALDASMRPFEGGMKPRAAAWLKALSRVYTVKASSEFNEAKGRVVTKAWLATLEKNPMADLATVTPFVVKASGINGLESEYVMEIGQKLVASIGELPKNGDKPFGSWNEFLASKTNEELVGILAGWKSVTETKNLVAKQLMAQNVAKLEASLEDRKAAAGVTAKFFRKPDLGASHWTLFSSAGLPLGRITVAAAAGGKIKRHVMIGEKKIWLESWLQSEQYGKDLVENTTKIGLKATLESLKMVAERFSNDFGDRRMGEMVPWEDLSPKQQEQAKRMFVHQTPISEHVGHNEPIGHENYHYQLNKRGEVGGRRYLSNKGMHKGRVDNLKKMPKPNLPASLKAADRNSVVSDKMLAGYFAAALFSSYDESDPETGGEPLDKNYDIENISEELLAQSKTDCEAFKTMAGDYIAGADLDQVGHDFWLTRNGHGAGFWDRPELYGGKENADALTDIAKSFGEVNLTVGDDGEIYGQ